MRNFKAIFKKQLKDTIANPAVLMNFIIFPLVALMMNAFASPDFYGVPDDMREMLEAGMPNMAIMMAAMFAGMAIIPSVTGFIAEDIERKSLRFLNMAGLKPAPYLLGVGSVTFFLSIFTSVAFGFISGMGGGDFWILVASLLSGVAASIMLGATIGMLCKNQQAATGLSMPVAMVLGFGPLLATFNQNIARILHPIYTQQLNVIADYIQYGGGDAPLWQSFAIIWANVAVLGILFAIVYVKKGLRG